MYKKANDVAAGSPEKVKNDPAWRLPLPRPFLFHDLNSLQSFSIFLHLGNETGRDI